MANGGTIEYGIKFNVDQSSLSNVRSELNRMAHELQEISKDKTSFVDEKTITNVQTLQKIVNSSWNNKLNQLNLTKFQSELAKSNISLKQMKEGFASIGKIGLFNNLTSELLTANTQLKVTNNFLDRIATTFGNVARYALSSKIFNNFTNSISQAYQYTVKLDTALNRIRIVSDQSAEQMDRFAINANKAAKALGASTLEYAKGALIYYQQGLDAAEADKRTEVTLKMANVLGASAEEVSNYMTAIWNNFKEGDETLEHYADVITALGAATASSSEEIATGLEKFSAVAKTIGLSYEYATTALATVVAQTRQSADTVGTAFKTIFARMEDLKLGKTLDDGTTLGKYSSTLAKIGVNIKDQNGQLKDMDTILNEMGAKWATLSKDQQVAVAQGVAGIRQYTQLTALLDNWDKFTQNLTVAQGSAGTLQKQQETYMESFEAHLQQLKTEAERTYSILFDADSAKGFLDIVTAGFSKINDMLADMGGGLNTFVGLLGQVGTIFSKQIGSEVLRVWDNTKTSLFGENAKKKYVQNIKETLKSSTKEEMKDTYGVGELSTKVVTEQADNVEQILEHSKGLSGEERNQLLLQEKKLAFLKQEVILRDKIRKAGAKEGVYTSEQAKAKKKANAKAGKKYTKKQREADDLLIQTLEEDETGVTEQKKRQISGYNQERQDKLDDAARNEAAQKNVRRTMAAVQGINAVVSAIKILKNESASTKEKFTGVFQSATSAIGSAISVAHPLVGMLVQIGGSLLGSILGDLFDFRSELEKLQDTQKEMQKNVDDAKNAYQDLKGTIDSYNSAKKNLESLTEGTVEFYEAVMQANEQAQKLIDTLNLTAGKDYGINIKTGAIEISEEALQQGLYGQQQAISRAEIGNLVAKQAIVNHQRDELIENVQKFLYTRGVDVQDTGDIKKLLTDTYTKTAQGKPDENGNVTLDVGMLESAMPSLFAAAIGDQPQEITSELSQFRAEYAKYAAASLGYQKQIAENVINSQLTKEQREELSKYSGKTQEYFTTNVGAVTKEKQEALPKWLTDESEFKTSTWAWLAGAQFYPSTSNNIDNIIEEYVTKILKGQLSADKKQYFDAQGNLQSVKDLYWNKEEDEADYSKLMTMAQNLYFNQSEGLTSSLNQLKEFKEAGLGLGLSQDDLDYATELYTLTRDYESARKLSAEEWAKYSREDLENVRQIQAAMGQTDLGSVGVLGGLDLLSANGDYLSLFEELVTGINKVAENNERYNESIEEQAKALGTTTYGLKLYDAALQKSTKGTVEYTNAMAQAAAESYKFNKAYNEGRKSFSSNKEALDKAIKSLETMKMESYDVYDAAGKVIQSLEEMGIKLNNEQLANPEVLKKIKTVFSGTAEEAEKAFKELEKISWVDEWVDQFNIAQDAAESFYDTLQNIKVGESIDSQIETLFAGADNVKKSLEDWKAWAEQYGIKVEVKNNLSTNIGSETMPTQTITTKHVLHGFSTDFLGTRISLPTITYTDVATKPGETLYAPGDLKFTKGASKVTNFTPSSSGSKSGGGGSSSKPKKIDNIDDEADRYHKINTQITKVDNQLKKVQSQQQKLVGSKLIENLDKQWQLLNTQVDNYNKKLEIARGEQAELAAILTKKGVQFNSDGTIANYMEAFQAQENYVNGLINQYNKLSKKQQEVWDNNKTIENAKENFNKFKENLNRYDELVASVVPGLEQSILDAVDKQIELNIKKFNMEIEVVLKLDQATRDWNKWKKRALEGIKEDDILGNAQSRLQDFYTYFNSKKTGEIQVGTKHVVDTLKELDAMDRGEANVYGDNREQALEDLKKYYDQLTSSITDVIELQDELHQAVLNEMDEVQEKFDDQIESYEFLRSIINHDLKVVQMVYGEKAYGEMSKFYQMQHDNYVQQLDFQRQQKEFWEAQMNAAEKGSEEWEKAKNNVINATKQIEETFEQSLENARNALQNTINDIFQNLNNRVTKGMGLEYVNEEWELVNKNADRYLDTVNKTYGIRELERKYIDAINKSSDINVQQKLKKVMDEQLTNLKQRDRLTKYELDRANKLYEIELAKIALEEAQMNKTQMRLRRDSQGNYTYQYVANDDKIREAEEKIENLNNELYNFDKDRYNSVLNDAYAAYSEYQQKLAEAAMINDPEERAKKELLIQEQYDELMTQIEQDYQISRYNLQDSLFTNLAILTQESLNTNNITYGLALSDIEGKTRITFGKISSIIANALNGASELSDDVLRNISEALAGTFGDISSLSDDTLRNIVHLSGDAITDIKGLSADGFDAIKNQFQTLTDNEKDIILNQFIPTWTNGISTMVQTFIYGEGNDGGMQAITDTFNGSIKSMQELFLGTNGDGGFAGATKQAWADMKDAEYLYGLQLNEVARAAGEDYEVIISGQDLAITLAQHMIDKNDEVISKYGQVLSAVQAVYNKVVDLAGAYQIEANAANAAAEAAWNYYQKELQIEAERAKNQQQTRTSQQSAVGTGVAASTTSSSSGGSGGSGSSSGGSSGSGSSGGSSSSSGGTTTKAKKVFTIYVTDGYSKTIRKDSVTEGNKYSLSGVSKPTRSGYTFKAWYIQSLGKEVGTSYSYTPTKDDTIKAVWTQTQSKKVVNVSSKTAPAAGVSAASGAIAAALGVLGLDSGGYTGSWENNNGRLALLHKKELVLNPTDTENMLNAVSIMRNLSSMLGDTVLSRLAGVTASGYSNGNSDSGGLLEQNVHIDATFPNVTNAAEIEQALNNLVNAASQRAYERR